MWTTEQQSQLNGLRRKELLGMQTSAEREALAALMAAVEADEGHYQTVALEQARNEQAALRERLAAVQGENEELARLLSQQEQLVTDARRWLAQFEQRHLHIQQTYTRLTGEVLVAA